MDFDTFERLSSNLGVHSVGIAASLDGLAVSRENIRKNEQTFLPSVIIFCECIILWNSLNVSPNMLCTPALVKYV